MAGDFVEDRLFLIGLVLGEGGRERTAGSSD
jgi:hypothetical protein